MVKKIRNVQNKLIGSAHKDGAVGGTSWFREGANFYPKDELFENNEIDELISDHIICDTPEQPYFNSGSNIITLGSCFARELQKELEKNGKRLDHLWMPAGLNNTFALRQFIQWVITGERDEDAYWYDAHEKGGAALWEPNTERERYLEYFKMADGFVLTNGLAEVWKDTETDSVFWRGVPGNLYNPDKHKFEMSTVTQNTENLFKIYNYIRMISNKPIIYTLSPVPLRASFRKDMPCLVADCVSKSTLRAALFELFDNCTFNKCHYYPSYEIVKWLGAHLDMPMYSDAERDCRHVNKKIVSYIIKHFMENYFE